MKKRTYILKCKFKEGNQEFSNTLDLRNKLKDCIYNCECVGSTGCTIFVKNDNNELINVPIDRKNLNEIELRCVLTI